MQTVEDIKPIIADIQPQLPTPDASPVSLKIASARPTRVFLPPPRSFSAPSSAAVPSSSQIQSHIAFALACGRAAQLAALKRAMVTSALEARRQREREVLRFDETSGSREFIKKKDGEGVDSEGDVKMEDMPKPPVDASARSTPSGGNEASHSTESTGSFVHKRRIVTLLLTEHTTRRPAPYAVPAPRSVPKLADATSTSSTPRQHSSLTTLRRLSLPTCLLSLAARSKLPSKPSLQTPKSRPSLINTTWTHAMNEQRRAAFTLSAMAMGRLGAIKEEASEGLETSSMCEEDARLCGRRGKVVRPLKLL